MQTVIENMHRIRCEAESTRDVIFLFQRRKLSFMGLPDASAAVYKIGEEGDILMTCNDQGRTIDPPESVSLEYLFRHGYTFGPVDTPCVTETWITEGVFLDRTEAENYGKRRSYNYSDGYRAYGVCAEGDLASIIRGEAAVAETVMYYLQNVTAGYVGNNPQFWRKGGSGYTSYVEEAKEFTEAEAKEKLYEDSKKWAAWPVAQIKKCTYVTVEGQHLGRCKRLSV